MSYVPVLKEIIQVAFVRSRTKKTRHYIILKIEFGKCGASAARPSAPARPSPPQPAQARPSLSHLKMFARRPAPRLTNICPPLGAASSRLAPTNHLVRAVIFFVFVAIEKMASVNAIEFGSDNNITICRKY